MRRGLIAQLTACQRDHVFVPNGGEKPVGLMTDSRWGRELMFGRGQFDELPNVLGTAAAAAAFFQPKLGSQLAGHYDPGSTGFPDFRLGDSLAQAKIHNEPRCSRYVTIMRSIISMPFFISPVKALHDRVK